jgi:hypothetical protein
MVRKKLAEMTPIERMNKLMNGLSWELAVASVMSKRDKEKNDTNK